MHVTGFMFLVVNETTLREWPLNFFREGLKKEWKFPYFGWPPDKILNQKKNDSIYYTTVILPDIQPSNMDGKI